MQGAMKSKETGEQISKETIWINVVSKKKSTTVIIGIGEIEAKHYKTCSEGG